MLTPRSMPLVRHGSVMAAVLLLAAGMARAQFAHAPETSSDSTALVADSSSSASLPDGMNLAAEPTPAGAATGGQYGRSPYGRRGSALSHLAFEAGGGFNAPTPDSSNYITWGGNFTVGAGYRFTPYLSMLAEYQFIDSKLPAAVIAPTGANGGHAHIWSLTVSPVVDLFPRSDNSIYFTGGGGFYRKVTSFTDPVASYYCDYFGYCYIGTNNVVVGHFSSNQGGWNIGMGYSRKLGDRYSDSRMKLFAEARYLDVLTPAVVASANGLPETRVGADTIIIPVTVGIRW